MGLHYFFDERGLDGLIGKVVIAACLLTLLLPLLLLLLQPKNSLPTMGLSTMTESTLHSF